MQARKQEMKWGVFFCKKSEKWGVFFCKKSGPSLKAGCIMYSISIFYFSFYLFEGVCMHPTHPPAYRPGKLFSICLIMSVSNCLVASPKYVKIQTGSGVL